MMAEQQGGGEDKPKIIIDDDWKRQAQAEKDRLAKEQQQRKPSARPGRSVGEMPPADFATLVSTFFSQALVALGMIEHPSAGRKINLEMAKYSIDMLSVLEQKTKGNLAAQEKDLLDQALHQTRMAFVEVASQQPGPIG